jgi:hypothetical protein
MSVNDGFMLARRTKPEIPLLESDLILGGEGKIPAGWRRLTLLGGKRDPPFVAPHDQNPFARQKNLAGICLHIELSSRHRGPKSDPARPSKVLAGLRFYVERMTGLEPATAGLGSQYSTIELHPLVTM